MPQVPGRKTCCLEKGGQAGVDHHQGLQGFDGDRLAAVFSLAGVRDDGLAQRQTGKALTKNGNALDTGDEDMVKVQEKTSVKVAVSGSRGQIENGMRQLCRVAMGASVSTGCRLAVSAD